MAMIADDQQAFDGLVSHLKHTFQSEETMSKLISEIYGQHQKKRESEDVFADDLQILVRKIIAHKPSFRAEANNQLKHQHAHKLHDQCYTAIAQSVLQTSDHMENFTQFYGHLALTFGSHNKLGKLSSQLQQLKQLPQQYHRSCESPDYQRTPDRDKTG